MTLKELEFNYINLVYTLDLDTMRWMKSDKMSTKRTLYQHVPVSNSHFYAFGGDSSQECEKFD